MRVEGGSQSAGSGGLRWVVAEVNPVDLNTLGTVSNEKDDVGTVLQKGT